ncbi:MULTISPECIES: SAM-dependent methyltransferase [unclassified Streptomyces]|uniref:SAM-dependent methyltransferase n=1 Tax=unclassified Streptomyces TaxID=2593676 RepID=UPI00336A2239
MTQLDAIERTCLLTAALRAGESRRDDRLYHDPYAQALVGDAGPELLAEIRSATFPEGDVPRTVPSTFDFNPIRTRFFDDWLRSAAADSSMTQIVLAPAGMDARAYRLGWPDHIRFFELDRPSVLEVKEKLLAAERPGADRRPVPADLLAPGWEDALLEAGYDPALPSTWLFEGLLYYFSQGQVEGLLRRVAAVTAPGSRIGADVVNDRALTAPNMRGLLEVFAGWGCPWVFGTDEPEALFGRHGFTVEAVQPGEPSAHYGRWRDPVPPRTAEGAERVFLVHGSRTA